MHRIIEAFTRAHDQVTGIDDLIMTSVVLLLLVILFVTVVFVTGWVGKK